MRTKMPPPILTTDAIVKRMTLAALVGLIAARFLSTLTAALIAVAVLYALLILSNTAR